MRIIHAMKARNKTSPQKKAPAAPSGKATNLYLSDEARTQAEWLKDKMRRPSISNVVETLIFDKAETFKPAAPVKAALEGVGA